MVPAPFFFYEIGVFNGPCIDGIAETFQKKCKFFGYVNVGRLTHEHSNGRGEESVTPSVSQNSVRIKSLGDNSHGERPQNSHCFFPVFSVHSFPTSFKMCRLLWRVQYFWPLCNLGFCFLVLCVVTMSEMGLF